MADDDRQTRDEDADLRLPSLRSPFRRRRRTSPASSDVAESAPDDSADRQTQQDADVPVLTTEAPPDPLPDDSVSERRVRRPIRLHLPGAVAAVVTGALVGLVMVGLTSSGLHLCTSMRGTSSCGNPGILLLLAITVVAVLLGSLLLALAGVATHASTSFLGVALLAVVVLLALLSVLGDWWVVLVVPVLAMLTYLASWWLTTTYADAPRG